MFYSNTLTWIICNLDIKLIFLPVIIHQARAVFAQRIQPSFPRAEHADMKSRLCKPRGKERRKRARADDQNICIHLV